MRFLKIGQVFLLSLALVSVLFFLQENIGLNLADEGYVWYGAIQTAHGAVPLRDFHGYDPGRYYWIAFWLQILGEDIMSLRLAVALFQVLGLTSGLLAIQRVTSSRSTLAFAGVILIAWMYPRHKLFEPSLAMMAVYVAVRLIEKPGLWQYFLAGVYTGLAGFMGRNHGLYSAIAFLGLILLIWFRLKHKSLLSRVSLWLSGIVVGYTPMLFMILFIPGMYVRFSYLFTLLVKQQATNLPLPVPWPWQFNYTQLDWLNTVSSFFMGSYFLFLPLFYGVALLNIFFLKREDIPERKLFLATTFVGIGYMHYAFSRADLSHLAQGIHPLLLGLISLPRAFGFQQRRGVVTTLAVLLVITTIFAVLIPESPFLQKLRFQDQFSLYEITGKELWLSKEQGRYIDNVRQFVAQNINPHEGLLIGPHSAGLYPILQRNSPIWETHFLFPDQDQRQREIIDELNQHNVNWILLTDKALDGRNELRFRNTHPLVWKYLTTEFEPVEVSDFPSDQQFLYRKIDP